MALNRSTFTPAALLRQTALTGLFVAGAAAGDVCWTDVANFTATPNTPAGRISVDIGNLRIRGRQVEVWERTLFEAPPPGFLEASTDSRGLTELRSLWAINCQRSMLAIITAGMNGVMPPRTEHLEFHRPEPDTAGARIVGIVCTAAHAIVNRPHPGCPEAPGALHTPPGPAYSDVVKK